MPPLPLRAPARSRLLTPLLAALALVAPLLVAVASPAEAGPTVRRLAGADRFATAVAVSRSSHPNGAPVAVLTTGANFPDALAGGPAVSALGGPVLLVQRDGVPQPVRDELRRLRPGRILVLGGQAAVSDTATAQLRSDSYSDSYTVDRIAGAGRYDTAALLSETVFAPDAEVVYVATGADYPDALAGAAAAGAAKAPVLLVERDRLPDATGRELRRLAPRRIVVLGGFGAVSTSVEQVLAGFAPDVSRIAGSDRYATAVAVARARPGTPAALYLATGRGFADALTGGPAAARAGAPVLLVPGTCIPQGVHEEMERHAFPPLTLLGGTAVLSPRVATLLPCVRRPDGPLAPGVRLDSFRSPDGPWSGKIVSVAPSAAWRLDTVLAQDALPGLETTSSIARRTGALVAVNGDFALPGGRPVHAFAKDGRLLQTAVSAGRNFAVEAPTGVPHVGFPRMDVVLTVEDSGARYPISKVNGGASGVNSIALTTREAGTASPVPGSSCGVRITQTQASYVDGSGRTVQPYAVQQAQCGAAIVPGRDDVLTTPLDGRYAADLAALAPGTTLLVSWTFGWPGVLDAIGGNPTLLEGGRIMAADVDGTDAFSRRNPRTAVGYRPDGTVLLVTVDGRGADGSVGMSLRELANLFVELGATHALNLDGGGSTTMVVGRQIQNIPSDGPERPVSSALVVLDGPRPSSPALRTAPPADSRPTPLTSAEAATADRAIATDPGSTGGLDAAGRR